MVVAPLIETQRLIMRKFNLDDVDEIESLINETLTKLATNHIDPDTIAASINTIEFRLLRN